MIFEDIKILLWNANGIRNKKLELFDYLLENSIHICCLNETKLNCNIKLRHDKFSIFRLDNVQGEIDHGGVAIIVRRDVPCQLLPHFNLDIIEAIGISMNIGGVDTSIISAYYTGTVASQDIRKFTSDINKIMNRNNVILLGDLNARHPYWRCVRSNTTGNRLYQLMTDRGFDIYYPNSPTHFPGRNRTPSTLDILLTNTNHDISSVIAVDTLGSNHLPVLVEMNVQARINHNPRLVYCYSKTNWVRFRRELDRNIDLTYYQLTSSATPNDINQRISKLTEALNKTVEDVVPKNSINTQCFALNSTIRGLVAQRNAKRRQYKRNRHPQLRDEFNELNRRIEILSNQSYNDNFQRVVSQFIPNKDHNKRLWSLSRALKGKTQSIPVLKTDENLLLTDHEKAMAFKDSFIKSHLITVNNSSNPDTELDAERRFVRISNFCTQGCEPSILVKPKEIILLIKQLHNNKAPGEDNVKNIVVKNTSRKFIVAFTYIVNACLMTSYFPSIWKSAIVVPVHKHGKPTNEVTSYRPISLLPALGKLFERILLSRIKKVLDEKELIPQYQFGFREGHSTTHQIVRVRNYIQNNFRQHKSSGLLLMDLSNAFNTVWHKGLILKLDNAGFPKYLTKLIQSFLDSRILKVRVGKDFSEEAVLPAGVPQGSALSPTLFNIYMHDISTHPSCMIAQYADDVLMATTNKRAASIVKNLREAANGFSSYCDKWKLKINPDKCELVFFTKSISEKKYKH